MIRWFKVGEGGWINSSGGRIPRTPPEATLRQQAPAVLVQDLDIIVDQTRASGKRYTDTTHQSSYTKAFVSSDFIYDYAPHTLKLNCLLDFNEYNETTPGSGVPPNIWEIGIFTDHPTIARQKLMIAYGTFPMEIKDATKQIQHYVLLTD